MHGFEEDDVRGLDPSTDRYLRPAAVRHVPTLHLVRTGPDPGARPVPERQERSRRSPAGHGFEVCCSGSQVRVRGEVDRSNAHLLLEALEVAAFVGDGVTVHLGELEFIDLGGVRALACVAAALPPGRQMRLVSPPSILCRMLDIIGLAQAETVVYRSV
jgi:anti-anti-sigma factor